MRRRGKRSGLRVLLALFAAGWALRRCARSPAAPRAAAAPCDVYQDWRAGLENYDYLDQLDLRARTRGEYVYGYGQAVREHLLFRVRERGARALELSDFVARDPFDGTDTPLDRPPLRVQYTLEEGDFRFVEGAPYAPVERRYRCRFAARAWSGGTPYYAVLISERPLAATPAARTTPAVNARPWWAPRAGTRAR